MSQPATVRPAPPAHDDGKIVGIELLRFASAVAVLLFHYQHFTFLGTREDPAFVAAAQPFYGALRLLYEYGFYGVPVFWCISGFIFFWKYGTPIAERRTGGYRFFVLRFSRLYPLHFLTLLAVALLQFAYLAREHAFFVYRNNDFLHFVLQLFMASNWGLQIGDSFNGPIWSISVEVLVYAIFFVSLRYVSASPLFLAAVALASALVQVLGLSIHPVFECLMFFYLGCLTAVVYATLRRHPRFFSLAGGAAAAVVVLTVSLSLYRPIKPKYLLVVLSPTLIFLCVSWVRSKGLVARLLIPAGNMTYSSYLLHFPLQIGVVTLCLYAGWHIPFYSPGFFLGYLVVILALSALSYRYLEMPAQSALRARLMARAPVVARSLP